MNVNYSLDHHASPPRRAHADDAGIDLALSHYAAIPVGEHRLCHTGVHVAIPAGHVGMVFVRSSTGIKKHLVLSNGTGIIDSGYTGEIMLSLHNVGRRMRVIEPEEYIAQLVVVPIPRFELVRVSELAVSERGTDGIGSTDSTA
ncbi:deoxyuridine 5'-triphosphate nucleotidohydrolase [Corynebacterium sp. HMSC055A01]|uniref:dUTP diphosphatase n=1 Tax=Corynebacterium sp. HMSC055A01 TaxID=1715083 RepID=UPI0008A47876|nr:dUTP diphosphatase [Corynebacterium sp. HMSC055A01]OFN17779.1 deoxyuridine 5'-triphosphate nucleotidohydrolase [Corynebacterium sp. HMSC055A01]